MAKKSEKIIFLCNDCGHEHSRWAGQCAGCKEWNTIVEFKAPSANSSVASAGAAKSKGYSGTQNQVARNISTIPEQTFSTIVTGIKEFDRVFGDGITVGSTNAISGDPGAGKTTLLTSVSALISHKMNTFYATAEESDTQFRNRAVDRMKVNFHDSQFWIQNIADVDVIISQLISLNIKFAVIDSINAIYSDDFNGEPGSVSQIKGCAHKLNQIAKSQGITMIMVVHVTKEKVIAGPQQLTHIVDGVFHIETSEQQLRVIRSSKNRFGSTDVIGLFLMQEQGMISVDNPSKLFLSSSLLQPASGSAITCIREGNRNMLLEIQALATSCEGDHAQRVALGIQMNRLKMIGAVLRKHMRLSINHDIYVSLVGGLKLPEQDTSADLCIAVALLSSLDDRPLSRHACFLGEISLSGEIRPVVGGVQRIKEAQKIGFTHFIIPFANYHKDMDADGCTIHPIRHISELADCLKPLYLSEAHSRKKPKAA